MSAGSVDERAHGFEVDDSLAAMSAVFDEAERRGWTDGLPIIPPTPEAVAKMAATVAEPVDAVIGRIPPSMAEASVERLAVCATMAGCRPAYFPVVIAAIRALLEPQYELYGINTTTNPVAPMLVVNGPIRERIDLNCSYGALGPGWRANATIGRAISLAMINIGRRIPGVSCKATHAFPARYSFCFGEFEEVSPWEPLHVERGFDRGDDCVTVLAPSGTTNIIDMSSRTAEGILTTIASSMTGIGSVNMFPFFGLGPMVLVLCPDHARKLGDEGLSKRDVKEFLFEATKHVPLEAWPEEYRETLRASGRVVDGCTPLAARSDQFEILVVGGRGGYHDVFMPTFGDSWPITKRIPPIVPAS